MKEKRAEVYELSSRLPGKTNSGKPSLSATLAVDIRAYWPKERLEHSASAAASQDVQPLPALGDGPFPSAAPQGSSSARALGSEAPFAARKTGKRAGKAKYSLREAWRNASKPRRATAILLVLTVLLLCCRWGLELLTHKGADRSQQAAAPADAARPQPKLVAVAMPEPAVPEPAALKDSSAERASAPPRALERSALRASAEAGKTAERSAIDAVASGDYGRALHAYRELAQAHPERPVFAEAERILEIKVRLQKQ